MSTRQVILGVSLAFVALLLFVTCADAFDNGVSLRTVLSLPIIVLLGIGVVGALAQPPRD